MKENSSDTGISLHKTRNNIYHENSEKKFTLKYNLQGRVHRAQWGRNCSSHDSFPSGVLLGRKQLLKDVWDFFEIPENSESPGQVKKERIRGPEHSVGQCVIVYNSCN